MDDDIEIKGLLFMLAFVVIAILVLIGCLASDSILYYVVDIT